MNDLELAPTGLVGMYGASRTVYMHVAWYGVFIRNEIAVLRTNERPGRHCMYCLVHDTRYCLIKAQAGSYRYIINI